MSVATLTSAPLNCSGAMYSGVPTGPCVAEAPLDGSPAAVVRARPKSMITTRGALAPGTIITLAGLRSRCTTPSACAAESPSSSSRNTRSAWSAGRPASLSSRAASVCPASSSMVRNTRGAAWLRSSSSSWTRQTLRCATRRASWISRLNRARAWSPVMKLAAMALTATSTPSCRSRAAHTSPMPPRPASRSSSKRSQSTSPAWKAPVMRATSESSIQECGVLSASSIARSSASISWSSPHSSASSRSRSDAGASAMVS